MTEQQQKLNAIARACHEVNRAYCQALGDNSQPAWEDGPEVALVVEAAPLAGGAEGLTRAAPGPDLPVVGPPGEAEGEAPPADSCEKMALVEAEEINGVDLRNGSFVDMSIADVPRADKVAQPLGCVWVEFVIVVERHGQMRPRLIR
jgi:hypothetical protein